MKKMFIQSEVKRSQLKKSELKCMSKLLKYTLM